MDSLQGADMAPGHRPLDLQIPPAADRRRFPLTFSDSASFICSRRETLPLVRLDKEVQVEMVHALVDVVPVRSHQILVVVDLRLWGSTKTTKQVNKTPRQAEAKRKRLRYLSEEVADDGVGQGVSQAAELGGGRKPHTRSVSFISLFFF